MNTKCPGCAADLRSFFVLSRWNPYWFPCPHCHAPLAFAAASKLVAAGAALALTMVAIGIFLEETGALPSLGGVAFGLLFSVMPLFLVVAFLQKHGRLRVEIAQDRSQRLGGRYAYALVILAPAFLLLATGIGLFMASSAIPATDPERYAKQETILEQVKAGTLPPERATRLVAGGIAADRAESEFNHATKRMLSFFGWLITMVAIWLLIAGYLGIRKPNKTGGRAPPTNRRAG